MIDPNNVKSQKNNSLTTEEKNTMIDPFYADERDWELPSSVEPLVNVISFGWIEDGRCGYPSDGKDGEGISCIFGLSSIIIL